MMKNLIQPELNDEDEQTLEKVKRKPRAVNPLNKTKLTDEEMFNMFGKEFIE